MTHRPSLTDTPDWDPCTKWVRVVGQRANGMVEFEFAVGEPQLYVEMVMPRTEFESFCALHGVTPTQGPLADAPAGSAEHEWDWNLRSAREKHFRRES